MEQTITTVRCPDCWNEVEKGAKFPQHQKVYRRIFGDDIVVDCLRSGKHMPGWLRNGRQECQHCHEEPGWIEADCIAGHWQVVCHVCADYLGRQSECFC